MIFWVWRGRTVQPQHDMAFPLSVESLHKSNSYTTHGIPKVLVLKFHQQNMPFLFFHPTAAISPRTTKRPSCSRTGYGAWWRCYRERRRPKSRRCCCCWHCRRAMNSRSWVIPWTGWVEASKMKVKPQEIIGKQHEPTQKER